MAKFCTKCGRPLVDGQPCSCVAPQQNAPAANNTITIRTLIAKLKNQIGLGDPIMNETDAFENDKKIVPDCIKANDSEIPVKQYRIATLRNRLCGIPYAKAIGRIQVTNKRVIFRAPGRCLMGRTTLQHEFAIDEIAGVESRREYVFNIWDMIGGLLCFGIGGYVGTAIIDELTRSGMRAFLAFFFSFVFALGATALFFLLKKKWALKLLAMGVAECPLLLYGFMYSQIDKEFLGGLMLLGAIVLGLLSLFTLFVQSIRPNLALVIKTKSASEAIDIRRKVQSLFGGSQNDKADHTGYTEIYPAPDAELSIREIGAMINDIQKMGDFGVEKWKI